MLPSWVSTLRMRDGFSGAVVSLLFVVSLVALLSWFACFVFDAAFFGRPRALEDFG